MSKRNKKKWIHFFCTGWFVLCIGYIFVLTLRQAGLHWWAIFSLSGHSAVVVFLLISLYLFAVFKGFDRSQEIEIEHPLTCSSYYAIFYDVSPLLGGLAGYIGSLGISGVSRLMLGVALGTLATTFLIWIVVDPAIAFAERMLPASRKHRLERLAKERVLRHAQVQERKHLLAELLSQDERDRSHWYEALKSRAEELAELLITHHDNSKQAECKAVEIGADAWHIGGLSCMQELHDMAIAIYKQKNQSHDTVDYITAWWDGIGSWRNPAFC